MSENNNAVTKPELREELQALEGRMASKTELREELQALEERMDSKILRHLIAMEERFDSKLDKMAERFERSITTLLTGFHLQMRTQEAILRRTAGRHEEPRRRSSHPDRRPRNPHCPH